MKRIRLALATLAIAGLVLPVGVAALWSNQPHKPVLPGGPDALPNTMARAHYVGNLWTTLTNWGFFGNDDDLGQDPNYPGGSAPYPKAQFPAGAQQEYLFQGALWVGGYKSGWDEPRVSYGADGWEHINEMYPDEGAAGAIIERSTIYNDPGAISQEDIIARMADTLTASAFVPPDPTDGPHVPLGVWIENRSYAWSYNYAQDFVLYDFGIVNINETDSLFDVYMALYMDHDCYHTTQDPSAAAQDDITGFRQYYHPPVGDSQRINIAWIADNDGDPVGGAFGDVTVRHVTGVRVVRAPGGDAEALEYTFNWYISNSDEDYDWGPYTIENSQHPWGTGWDGTPEGDIRKYFLMTNGEFDYDQIYANMHGGSPAAPGYDPAEWADPANAGVPDPLNLADGFDTRYLLSFGPVGVDSVYDETFGRYRTFIPPAVNRPTGDPNDTSWSGDAVWITVAYVGGENFQVNPGFDLTDPNFPATYYDPSNHSFADLAYNADWAALVFDNDGDGVPDFKGPPPPNSPDLMFETEEGSVTILWNRRSEDPTYLDPFSYRQDFEGYRVYISSTGRLAEYSLLVSYDEIDYDSFFVNSETGEFTRWPGDSTTAVPLLRDTLLARHGLTEPVSDDSLAALGWYPHDWNRGFLQLINENGSYDEGEYYVDVDSSGTYTSGDFLVDGLYTYTVSNLLPKAGKYFAVTAFDFGDPQSGTEPLESSVALNAEFVVAGSIASATDKVYAVPNPYRADAEYNNPDVWGPSPWEDPDQSGWSENDRHIRFVNLPGACTVRIFTLDGDLVQTLEAGTGATYVDWDLISRNMQAIVSGVYLFAVEPISGESQIGKFVVIK